MARVGMTGFEIGHIEPDTSVFASVLTSGMSYETSIVRTGARALKCVAPSGSNNTISIGPASMFARIYVRVTVLPATERVLIGLTQANAVNLRLQPDGRLNWYDGTAFQGAGSVLLTDPNHWYRIDWRGGPTGGSTPVLFIDGVAQVSLDLASGKDIIVSVGAGDTIAATYTAYFDDFASDDAAFPGDGKVVLLLPTSDNNRNGWTGGVGGTTNLFDAVNNQPPIGTATETDLTQIESATNSATDNCDFNMTTYSAAGIGPIDTVKAVQAVCAHGEDIATGTKAGALLIVSNPTQSPENTFNFGDDIGALGTYNTAWATKVGVIQNSPSVTLGTAPVLRIGKRTATTRVVSCCFLGIYVDYTPAVFLAPKAQNVSQAVHRAANW